MTRWMCRLGPRFDHLSTPTSCLIDSARFIEIYGFQLDGAKGEELSETPAWGGFGF